MHPRVPEPEAGLARIAGRLDLRDHLGVRASTGRPSGSLDREPDSVDHTHGTPMPPPQEPAQGSLGRSGGTSVASGVTTGR